MLTSAVLMTPTSMNIKENAGVQIADQFLLWRLDFVMVLNMWPRRLSENISRYHIVIQKIPNRNVATGIMRSCVII